MQLETVSISKLVLLIGIVCGLSACAETAIVDPPIKNPETRVFLENYDKVWRSVQQALRRYPIRINNMDAGILETDYIKGDKLFNDPNELKPRPGLRYRLTVRVVKGKVEGKSAVKVTVLKSAELQPDFFSGFQTIPSNGLEELAMLYRIGRYLEIDRLLSRVPPPK